MKVKSFDQLSEAERQKLYQFVVQVGPDYYFSSYGEMLEDYLGFLFSQGKGHFSLWKGKDVIATAGVITEEIASRGEAFITGLTCAQAEQENFPQLFDAVIGYTRAFQPRVIRLGVPWEHRYLASEVERAGFEESYRALVFRHQGAASLDELPFSSLSLQELTVDNSRVFQRIHDDAFRDSPNSGCLAEEELEARLRPDSDLICGIALEKGQPVGAYELKVEGDTGWIEFLAISPSVQGQGLGKRLLLQLVNSLYQRGCREVKLFVISSNTRASNLYSRTGFVQEQIATFWYSLDLTK